jgi:16S rRNA (guanine966-N2)-methyltransferase
MSELRILGGTAKGRRLHIPDTARPTGARVRKSLFDILETRYGAGSSLLDLYAGAGGVGLEAASRGYAVTLVERDARAVQTLERNARELQLPAHSVRGDATAFVARTAQAFDIVFVDPPYAQDIPKIASATLARPELIASDGVLIVQSPVQIVLYDTATGFTVERRVYGSNALTFFWLDRTSGDK